MAGEYDAAIQLLIKAQDQTGPAFSSLHNNLGKTTQQTGLANAAFSIFSGVAVQQMIGQLQAAGAAANEHELALNRLTNAVDTNGGSWAKNGAQIEAYIASNRKLGFADKDVMDALSLLTVETGSYEEGLKRLTSAENLSRATGMDLYTASRLLGKVTDENVSALARWGITVEKGSTAEELLAKVYERTGDAAEKASTSTAIHAQVIANALNQVYVKIGESSSAIQALAILGPKVGPALGIATGAITYFTRGAAAGGKEAQAFSTALSSIGSAGIGLARVLGPAGIIVIGAYETTNALHALFKTFAAPGSEGEKIAQSMDQFAAISESHGGGIGGFVGTLKDIYLQTNGDTVLGRFLKDQDAAKAKQDAVTAATQGTVAAIKDAANASAAFLKAGGGTPGGGLTGKVDSATILAHANALYEGLGIKVPESLSKAITDAANGVLGASAKDALHKYADDLYKEITDPFKAHVTELQAILASPDEIKKMAEETGKTQAQYVKDLKQQIADAQATLKVISDEASAGQAELLKQAGDESTAQKKLDDLAQAKLKKVHEERDVLGDLPALHDQELSRMLSINNEWDNIIGKGKTYGYILSHLTTVPTWSGTGVPSYMETGGDTMTGHPRALGGPMLPGNVYTVGEQNRREAIVMGVGSDSSRDGMGGVTIMPGAIALHYAGAADQPAAMRLGSDIVDVITETLRQQTRRVGRRASPFGAV